MSQSKVPALDHALRILGLLASVRGPLPASAIAQQLELPRSTVYQLLATLAEHGYVMHLPEERRWGLGLATVELSSAYARQEPISRLGRPLVRQLVDRLGFSGHLALLHGQNVVYVVEERAPGAPSMITDIDVRLPAHSTASGRAVLSAMPKAQVRALFPNSSAFAVGIASSADPMLSTDRAQPVAIDRYSRLRQVLDDTAARGYALEQAAVSPGLASISVPVLDHRGWPVAAMTATFPHPATEEDTYPAIAREVSRAAETLSSRLYNRGPREH
ncbi:IclR family transcriptional regulator [Leucobacter sp. CSA1]|uniref:Glycerol operon regulatory protein n=1 Tax=Leucobacter chromiisoli TaxID=2796471 RepID=A0A934Q5A2_9MICO|nr:IclR family transcriptional regulator [Leucobacter chromiisoli]MBK0417893.1 IclR family transcriptional regulator [Leucobacter chromiisoli]